MAEHVVLIAVAKHTAAVGQQLTLFIGAKHHLETLKVSFDSILIVLADAENKQVSSRSVRLWFSRLQAVACDIDNLLVDWQVSSLEKFDGIDELGRRRCFPLPFVPLDWARSRFKLVCRVQEIQERLDEIAADKNRYKFIPIGGFCGHRALVAINWHQTRSLMEESGIVGRDDDRVVLVKWEQEETAGGSCDCGGGYRGIGENHLCAQLNNDGKVHNRYENALYWVCVFEGFHVVGLTRAILEQVKGANSSLSQLDSLHKDLLQALREKRFLLVLDDVWNSDVSKW